MPQRSDFCIQGNKTHVQYCRFYKKIRSSLFAVNQDPLITCVPDILRYSVWVIVTLTLITAIRVQPSGNRSLIFVHSLFGG